MKTPGRLPLFKYLLLLTVTLGLHACVTVQWSEFSNPDNDFTALFPEKVQTTTRTENTENGQASFSMYSAEAINRTLYSVSVIHFAIDTIASARPSQYVVAYMQEYIRIISESNNGNVLEFSRPIKSNGFSGSHLKVNENNKSINETQVIPGTNKCFIVAVTFPIDLYDSQQSAKFFDSFRQSTR